MYILRSWLAVAMTAGPTKWKYMECMSAILNGESAVMTPRLRCLPEVVSTHHVNPAVLF